MGCAPSRILQLTSPVGPNLMIINNAQLLDNTTIGIPIIEQPGTGDVSRTSLCWNPETQVGGFQQCISGVDRVPINPFVKIINNYFNNDNNFLYFKINYSKFTAEKLIIYDNYYIVENDRGLFLTKCENKAIRMADLITLCCIKNNEYKCLDKNEQYNQGYDFTDHHDSLEYDRWGNYVKSNIYILQTPSSDSFITFALPVSNSATCDFISCIEL